MAQFGARCRPEPHTRYAAKARTGFESFSTIYQSAYASELYCVASHPNAQTKFYSSGSTLIPIQKVIDLCEIWAKETENEPAQCQIEFCDQFADVAHLDRK